MEKERKKAMSQAKIMIQSSRLTLRTMKYRQMMRAPTKAEARANVAVVTAKTAGPRFGIDVPSSSAAEEDMAR
jgi:hypothetical protein